MDKLGKNIDKVSKIKNPGITNINNVDEKVLNKLKEKGLEGLYEFKELYILEIIDNEIIIDYLSFYYNLIKNSIYEKNNSSKLKISNFDDFCKICGFENGKIDKELLLDSIDTLYEIYSVSKFYLEKFKDNILFLYFDEKEKRFCKYFYFRKIILGNNGAETINYKIQLHYNYKIDNFNHYLDGYDDINKFVFECKNYYSTNISKYFSKFIRDVYYFTSNMNLEKGYILFRHKEKIELKNNLVNKNIEIIQIN